MDAATRKRVYRKEHRDRCRASQRKCYYGITEAQYLRLLEQQEDGCAICGEVPRLGERELGVDHDHRTGEVRGLLCINCNHGLGKFKDDPARLREAADYLEGKGGV